MSTKHKILLAFAILILFNFLLVIFFGDEGLVDLHLRNDKKNSIQKKNEVFTQKNKVLYREIDRLKNDPEFIENTARKELGMIKSGEIIFKMAPPNKGS